MNDLGAKASDTAELLQPRTASASAPISTTSDLIADTMCVCTLTYQCNHWDNNYKPYHCQCDERNIADKVFQQVCTECHHLSQQMEEEEYILRVEDNRRAFPQQPITVQPGAPIGVALGQVVEPVRIVEDTRYWRVGGEI